MIDDSFPRHAALVASIASACKPQIVRRVVGVLGRQPLAVVDRPALLVQKRRRDARLLAPEHLESEREGRREIVAREARVHG